MSGANLAGRGHHERAVRRPGGGREAVHRRRPRPRHQGQHPADDGRARHRGARAARHRDPRRRAGGRSRTGCSSPTAPATRRPRPARSSCCSGALERGIPYFGICFGNQLFGRALGFGTYKLNYGHRGINQPVMDRTTGKVEVTAHNHGFAVDAPAGRADRRRRTASPRSSHVCLNDDVVEGLELRVADGRAEGVLGPVPPGGGRRPARRGVPLRPVRASLMERRPSDAASASDITSVLVIGSGPIVIGQACEFDYSGTQACRVLQGRGHPGRPGQLQPGDDHDRPGVRRRDVRRADHAGVRREGDRQGAPRRAAGHPRRPDRAQLRDGAGRAPACWRSTASS